MVSDNVHDCNTTVYISTPCLAGVDIIGYTFECHLMDGRIVHVDMEKMEKVNVLHKETDPGMRIHCPSIILEILPDSGKAL